VTVLKRGFDGRNGGQNNTRRERQRSRFLNNVELLWEGFASTPTHQEFHSLSKLLGNSVAVKGRRKIEARNRTRRKKREKEAREKAQGKAIERQDRLFTRRATQKDS